MGQSDFVIRPPAGQADAVTNPAADATGLASPKLVTSWGAPVDTNSRLSTFTASAVTGVVTGTWIGDTVIYDGCREVPIVTAKIKDELPEFDPELHDLQVVVVFDTLNNNSGSGGDLHGVAVYVVDDPASAQSTMSGGGFGIENTNLNQYRATGLGTSTTLGGTNNLTTGPYSKGYYNFTFAYAGASMEMSGVSTYRNASDNVENGVDPDLGAGVDSVPDNIYIAVGFFHRNTGNTFQPTIAVRVFLRLIPKADAD